MQSRRDSETVAQAINNVDKVAELEEKILCLKDENLAIKETMKMSNQSKEKEVALIQEMIEKQKASFNSYIAELKQRLQKSGVKEIPTLQEALAQRSTANMHSSNENDAVVEQLEFDNARLKTEIAELRTRYNVLALQLQIRQQQ